MNISATTPVGPADLPIFILPIAAPTFKAEIHTGPTFVKPFLSQVNSSFDILSYSVLSDQHISLDHNFFIVAVHINCYHIALFFTFTEPVLEETKPLANSSPDPYCSTLPLWVLSKGKGLVNPGDVQVGIKHFV